MRSTAYIAWWVIDTIDNWVRPWLPRSLWPDGYLPFHVPGFGVVIAFVGLTLLGFLTANFIGRSLVRFGEAMLDRTPLVRGVYKGLKQVFETIFSQSGSQFRKVGLVEFPVKGSWSIVFISSAPAEIVAGALPGTKPMISAFMPCTPNPTTGFFFYIPADEVIELPISADEAAKLVMSAGLIQPQGQAALAAMARSRQARKAADGDAAVGRRAVGSAPPAAQNCLPRFCPRWRHRRPSLDAVSALKLCYEAAGVNIAANSLLAASLAPARLKPSIRVTHMAQLPQFDLAELKRRMQAAHATLKHELGGLRTGRASASLLEPVQVEAYGQRMPLSQVATISVPEPRALSVSVWDKSMVQTVDKAIRDANLGLSPTVEGTVLRIRIPELNEQRRKEMVKIAHKYSEDARVAVRHVRRDGLDILKKLLKEHAISEDDEKRQEAEVQKATDQSIQEVDASLAAKEKEIMQV